VLIKHIFETKIPNDIEQRILMKCVEKIFETFDEKETIDGDYKQFFRTQNDHEKEKYCFIKPVNSYDFPKTAFDPP